MSRHNDVLRALNRLVLCACIAGARAATMSTTPSPEKTAEGKGRLFNLSANAKDTLISALIALGFPLGIAIAVFILLRPHFPRAYLIRYVTEGYVYTPGRWFRNMFFCKSEEAFAQGISLDGCMQILSWDFGFRVFTWFILIAPLPLCINWFGAGSECPANAVFAKTDGQDTVKVYTKPDGTKVFCGEGIDFTGAKYDAFTRLTMTAFQKDNLLAWGHVVTMWILTFIVIRELGRANKVFTTLRSKWLLQREEPVASSVMVINSTSRSDKEFSDLFERMFPGKVVAARLVKFCRPLANTCAEIAAVEDKIELAKIKEAAKNKKAAEEKEDNEAQKLETTSQESSHVVVDQQNATQGDSDVVAVDQDQHNASTGQQNVLALPGEAIYKMGNMTKAGLKFLIGADLATRHAQLLEKKKEQQLELFALMEQREQKVEELRTEEEKARKESADAEEMDLTKSAKQLFSPNGMMNMATMMGTGANTLISGAAKTVGGTVQGMAPIQVPLIPDDEEVFSTMGFVTFTDIATATLAVQASYSADPRLWQMSVAPNPKDVLWYDVATRPRSTNQKNTFLIYAVVAALFISWSPVVILINAKVSELLDNSGAVKEGFVGFLYGFLEGILKNIANIIFFALLPKVFFKVLVISGRVSKNSAFLEVQHYLVLFKMFFTVFATSLGKPTSELFSKLIESFRTGGNLDLSGFSFSATFGTSVPSEFPTMFAFAATKLPDYGAELAQFGLFQELAIQYLIWRIPLEHAWTLAQKESCKPLSTPKRFASGAVLFGVGILIYLVFPLNALMFWALFLLGGACFRYRVLYTDRGLVDSGGIFWTQFEFHVAAILVVMQITGVVVITSILGGLWTMLLTLPLPIISVKYLLRLRKTKWQFVSVADPDFSAEKDVEAGKSGAIAKSFPYVQPQLVTAEDQEKNERLVTDEEHKLVESPRQSDDEEVSSRTSQANLASLSIPLERDGAATIHTREQEAKGRKVVANNSC
eukprot:GEMP01002888.1.p1 GENE.GEMP01002888.1~~GEMP01002888.1.p1  ORF type:complete len:989 (+),score=207.19 GEMP01002888.1:161-3127(+)